jgi:uncharacterized membrane protein
MRVIHNMIPTKPAYPLLTGLVIPVVIPLLAFKIGGHLGGSDSTTVLASMAWIALVAGAGWLSFAVLSHFGHSPAWRSILIGILCLFAVVEGCNHIDQSAPYHLGDPEEPHGSIRGR